MSEANETQLSRTALAAFVLGVSSLVLFILTALPALYVGLQAVRDVNSSDGRLRGRGLAIAGMAVAGVMTVATVIGFIGLILLLFQGNAQRVGCTNNLRLIGQAVGKYSVQNEQFPAATVPNAALPPERRLSWQAALMPLLADNTPAGKSAGKLTNEIAFGDPWDAIANAGPRQRDVAFFLCPTFQRENAGARPGLTAYVGIAGIGIEAARLSKKDPNIGFFGYDRIISQADISAGTSNTMMATETMRDNGPWLAGGPATVRGLDPDETRYIGYGRPFGGFHRDGLNVLRADGSVPFVRDYIDPPLFRINARIAHE